jgi:hypothetical protein
LVKGGFYFHPGDVDLSPGTPERKKPLSIVLPEYSYWRTTVGPAPPGNFLEVNRNFTAGMLSERIEAGWEEKPRSRQC